MKCVATHSFFFLDVLNNAAYGAIQDEAKIVQRFRCNGHATLHSVDRVRRHALSVNQLICGYVALVQRFPEGTVRDHAGSHPAFFLP